MRMSDEEVEEVEVISSGSLGLDTALGVGGYPRGRVIEIYGLKRAVKQRWLFMPLPKRKKQAA